MADMQRVIYFTQRPTGMVTRDAFEVREESVPRLGGDKDVLVETVYASVDPYMRGRLSAGKSYTAPFEVGKPMTGAMVGRVVDGGRTSLQSGEWVFGSWPWSEYAVLPESALRRLDPSLPPTTALHVLGLTGLTAYVGLTKFGRPQPAEHLVVSAAAGSVGSLAVQIGRLLGLTVYAIAGGDDKCRWVEQQLGAAKAFNYQAPDFAEALSGGLAGGVDIYFDNVGGVVTDEVMRHLNPHARVVICGQIALYNQIQPSQHRPLFSDLLISRAEATGFIVGEHQEEFPKALKRLQSWYRLGQLKVEESIVVGFDQWIDAFLGLFSGANRGKAIVQVKDA